MGIPWRDVQVTEASCPACYDFCHFGHEKSGKCTLMCTRLFTPAHPTSFHSVLGLPPSLGPPLPQLSLWAFPRCRVEEGRVLSGSSSGTLDLTFRQRLSCPDNPQLISTATPPAKVAQHVLGHQLPGVIKIAAALQLLNDEFWKEMIDSHS